MSRKAADKGRALERAVKFIQQTILKSDPNLKGARFTIEVNQIVRVANVRHEIDVLVKTLPGSAYESTYIFECKNWNTPVSKNDVIILGAKVNAVGASRGFLVAKALSRDASAQLKQDPRLTFIQCADEFLSPLEFDLLHVMHEPFPVKVFIKRRGVPPAEHLAPVEWKDKPCFLNKSPINFLGYVKQHLDEMVAHDSNENSAKYRNEGTHMSGQAMRIEFEPQEFCIEEIDVEYMHLEVEFHVTVVRRKLRSKFELKGQGRVFSFEPLDDVIPGRKIEIDIVHRI